MALQFKVKTLDGMDEATAKMYIKVGDEYQLDIDGLEDTTGLKNTVAATRTERDALAAKLKEIEDASAVVTAEKAEAERLRLVEKGEYKTLAEQSQAKELATATELADLKTEIATGKRDKAALEATAGMTKDPARAQMLKEQALKFIQNTQDGVKFVGPKGDLDAAGLSAHLTTSFPFLVDGSQAGGGGANGGAGGHQSENNLKLSPTERINAARAEGS